MNRRAGGAMEAEDHSSVPAPVSAPVPGESHSDSSSAPETEGQLQSLSPLQCAPQPGKRPQIKCPAAKTHPLKKPRVPPKPVHFKPLGQERDSQRIPPAPRRPLPADPRPSRTLLTTEGETHISPDISSLIEKFESIWHPIPVLQRSQSHLPFRMESSLNSSPSPNTADYELAFGSGDLSEKNNKRDGSQPDVLGIAEPSSVDVGKLRELHIGDSQSFEDHSAAKPSKEAIGRDGAKASAVEQGSNGKIPNRDSGIDSPSCSVAGETFPTEEGGENKKYPSPGLLIEMEPEGEQSMSSPGDPQKEIAPEADSDVDEGSSEEPETADVPKGEDLDVAKCTEPQKLFNIANELLHTEEAYVKRLHLLDQVFCTKLAEAGIPSEVTTGIFSNISSIYCFHGQFLLPELQTRITQEWSTNPRIGDILQKLAPFLKMYGEYVKNFDRAMDMVNTWTQRSSPFKDVVQSIQKQEVCGNLTLQHHMLEPVQRIPRYEMLLKDYLKKLPGESPDRKDAEKSLELISTAANHSNAAIRKMEKMHKLLEVYERLGGEEDIVNPANELIKEGHIQKLSAKNGTAQDRYLFLFNSMLLYCVPKLRLIGQKFSVREKMDIAGLQVQEIAKPNATHTFTITGKKRSLDLQTRTEEEKKDWIEVILATIEKHKQKSETFRAFNSSFAQEEDVPDSPMASTSSVESMAGTDGCGGFGGLDSRKSKNRRDKEKQTCKSCSETFNSITKRRHHCKQCGAVICGKCSEFKADNSRQSRVCKECFLMQTTVLNSPVPEPSGEQRKKLEKHNITAPENSLFCSHLQLIDKGKVCCKLWATIPKAEPLVLYLQGGQDGRAPRTIPLPGYEVTLPGPAEKLEAKYTLKLSQSQQTLYLSVEDEELQRKWMEVLTRAAKGETDDPSASIGNPQGP
ncbi:FYVE, RhoGEF and PH domain-containing protein 3 isoform X1 [Monodelphis domestica]|uniref:FYVE, RhoGEF and PH domain-containing protein 3 isoform X1 n=2 Tax=Monodelphis domestica TaxID=13616 RepID=UPI0024E25791|nr:FYVE, RhoGEF and PH domain-containing protein 3 isoform X1 [Monodelphis domestica]